jgi:hypothetical protein
MGVFLDLLVASSALHIVNAYSSQHVSLASSSDAVVTEPIPEAQFVVTLSDKVSRAASKINALNHLSQRAMPKVGTLAGSFQDEEYITNVTFGNQAFTAIVGMPKFIAQYKPFC